MELGVADQLTGLLEQGIVVHCDGFLNRGLGGDAGRCYGIFFCTSTKGIQGYTAEGLDGLGALYLSRYETINNHR